MSQLCLCLLLYTEQENQRRNYFHSENVKTNDKETASDTLNQLWIFKIRTEIVFF